MPLFEYLCEDCGTQFEKIVSSSASAVECAGCGSRKVERQLSVFAVGGGDSPADEAGCGRCGAPEPGTCRM